MTCAGAYANVSDWEAMFCRSTGANQEGEVCRALALAAAPIKIALASVAACDCTMSDAGLALVKWINCLLAAATNKCSCSNITTENQAAFALLANDQLALIRSGELELCEGETGSLYPFAGDAAQGVTGWAQIDIIVNDILRNS